MQLRLDQLAGHLQKGLRPLYTLWGDEPLLAQEAADAIRAAARAAITVKRWRIVRVLMPTRKGRPAWVALTTPRSRSRSASLPGGGSP